MSIRRNSKCWKAKAAMTTSRSRNWIANSGILSAKSSACCQGSRKTKSIAPNTHARSASSRTTSFLPKRRKSPTATRPFKRSSFPTNSKASWIRSPTLLGSLNRKWDFQPCFSHSVSLNGTSQIRLTKAERSTTCRHAKDPRKPISVSESELEQFSCELPDFNSGEDENAASIDKYLQQVKTVIEGRQRWNVRRWLVLGHFAFGRSAMYADLKSENWKVDPVQHGLVSWISARYRGRRRSSGALPTIPDDYYIDDPEIEKVAPRLIQDADASQHSALIDVMRGKNLVIQGPPGTGKSQTITNIIANAMEAGKRVLFFPKSRPHSKSSNAGSQVPDSATSASNSTRINRPLN